MVLTIIGTRPQYIKSSIVSFELKKLGIEEYKIDTGQHYDTSLSKEILDSLPFPNTCHTIVAHFHYESILYQLEKKIKTNLHKVKAVLVYGDTHSAMAGALLAKKNGKKLFHIEAGERSGMLDMKEEFNRINIDYLSDICFCVNKKSYNNLQLNKYTQKKIVGDVMLDLMQLESVKKKLQSKIFVLKKPYIYFTLHRDENTNSIAQISAIIDLLKGLGQNVIWPMHPKCKTFIKQIELPSNIKIIRPVSYTKSLEYIQNAQCIITDSGGIQKEAYWLKKKCITLRPSTEWTETLKGNWNILLTELNHTQLEKALSKKTIESSWNLFAFGNGKASSKIASIIKSNLIG